MAASAAAVHSHDIRRVASEISDVLSAQQQISVDSLNPSGKSDHPNWGDQTCKSADHGYVLAIQSTHSSRMLHITCSSQLVSLMRSEALEQAKQKEGPSTYPTLPEPLPAASSADCPKRVSRHRLTCRKKAAHLLGTHVLQQPAALGVGRASAKRARPAARPKQDCETEGKCNEAFTLFNGYCPCFQR